RVRQYDRPVGELSPERGANTAIVALTALLIATGVGLPLGIVAGSRRGGLVPGAIRSASVVLLSMPPLLTSLFLVFVAARTGWFPIAGMRSATIPAGGAALDLLHHLVVPAASIGLPLAAMLERLQAQAMSAVIGEPFVLATRAVLMAATAPFLAPHAVDEHFGGLLNAPPTIPRIIDADGSWHAPFSYRWHRVSQLEQRYDEDRSVRVPLAWFSGGRLVRSA